jgi:hypothetical protein
MMKHSRIWDIDYGRCSREDLLLKLAKKKIALNADATLLFLSEKFVVSDSGCSAKLVSISLDDLGIKEKVTFRDICAESLTRGLQLCPLEIAPLLRLEYLDQKEGPMLTVASEVAYAEERFPNGYYLRNFNGNLWLRGYISSEDWLWDQESEFVFVESSA